MNLCISMDFQKLKVIDKYSDAREKNYDEEIYRGEENEPHFANQHVHDLSYLSEIEFSIVYEGIFFWLQSLF